MGTLGSFSHCMVESDPQSEAQARWLRARSLVLSLTIEAAIVAALVILPLLATGVLPPLLIFTSAVPYSGGSQPPVVVRGRSFGPHPERSVIFHPVGARPLVSESVRQIGEAPPAIGNAIGPAVSEGGILDGADHGSIVNLAPPRNAAPAKPLAQSEGVMAARLIRRVQPAYPYIAKAMRLQGTVRLHAIVAIDGSVEQLELLSGNPILARAAVEAVRQWRYQPTRLNGRPVEVETEITVTFVLN